MKKLIYGMLPLLFSFLCISAQSELINDATALEIGQRIGANAIISGNYLQAGGQVRIEARVVDVNSGTPIDSAKIQGSSNEILAPHTGINLSSYYFQPGNQLLNEIYSYEIRDLDAGNSVSNNIFGSTKEPPVAYLVGKLNTGEILNLSKLLNPGNTDAINLESDKTYQITFSGNLRFQAVVLGAESMDVVKLGQPMNIDVEFYGTDTFTLRPNETNIIQVDMARPPHLLLKKGHLTKMKWKLHVTNK